MRIGLDQREVESLAKTMEVKFTVSGPYIGGAKSGIDFDPSDPRKKGVLERWYKAVTPLLKHYYGTGGDLNVDEIHEVIPMTEANGVWHPQEGVFTGHFRPNEAQKVRRIGNLRQGVSQPVEDESISPDTARKIRVADLITGYGVSEAVRHFYDLHEGEVAGKRVDCVEELRKSPRLVQIFDKECVAKLSTRGHHCAEIGLGIAVRLDRVAIARGLNHLERRTGSGQLCDSGVVCGSEFAHGAQKLQLRAVCVRPA